MSRHILTNREWIAIRVFLPAERANRPGRPWSPHRRIINGILWVLGTGCSWADVPFRFGKPKTIYNRFRRWTREGLWDRVFETLIQERNAHGKINRSLWCVDSSVIRAHRVASGARKEGRDAEENAKKHALGRSRGGYSTKIHVATDAKGLPLAVTLTPGQAGETPEFGHLIKSIPLNLYHRSKRPKAIAGDMAYSANATRTYLEKHGIADVIPKRPNEQRRPRFARALYKKRNIVERVIGWLKESRRIATRYEKLAEHYLAMIKITAIRLILKRY